MNQIPCKIILCMTYVIMYKNSRLNNVFLHYNKSCLQSSIFLNDFIFLVSYMSNTVESTLFVRME